MIDVAAITEVRARQPGRVVEGWRSRRRRPLLGPDGRLFLVAADHPARGALGVRDDPRAMASRRDLLNRIATALSRPGVDGILASSDILDDLLIAGALEDKVVLGSMNRGGLQGASFEFDDRFTGYTPEAIAAQGLNGGKALMRICLDDPGTAATLQATAAAVTDLAGRSLITMIEPFLSIRAGDRVRHLLDADSVIKSMHIASGLGSCTAYTWLKIPVVDGIERVAEATTMPTVLLGGDPNGDPADTFAQWADALHAPMMRGLVAGRALLYPPGGDVTSAIDQAARLVHGDGLAPGVPHDAER